MQTATTTPAAYWGETPATLSGGISASSTTPPPSRILLSVRQLAYEQPALSEGGIRWSIFNRKTNGLEESGALVRRGSRVFVDRERYLSWLAGE